MKTRFLLVHPTRAAWAAEHAAKLERAAGYLELRVEVTERDELLPEQAFLMEYLPRPYALDEDRGQHVEMWGTAPPSSPPTGD
jgi:hypothetical protein